MEPYRLHIALPAPAAAEYDVVVAEGLLDRLAEHVRAAAPAEHYAVVADATVAGLLGERVLASFRAAGARAHLFSFPAGEEHKTRDTWADLTDALLGRGVGRDGCVVALGGGVTGDLAGFLAATYMRGLPLVQVPTTLVGMVDAAIGGKTGVDTPVGKNLVGAFHQPRAVLADPRVLSTLGAAELRAGLAEAVKHGAIADADYLGWIEESAAPLLAGDADAHARLIRRSVEIKADFVTGDVYEAGPRAALNFGHTIGHALERWSDYSLPHGQAVAIGMVGEAGLGEAAGVTEGGTAARLRRVLERLGLPVRPPAGCDPAGLVTRARADKKARRARVRYVLLARVGALARTREGWTFALEDERAARALAQVFA